MAPSALSIHTLSGNHNAESVNTHINICLKTVTSTVAVTSRVAVDTS